MRFYLVLIFTLFLYSCAQIVSPIGGPKDEIPPKIISENPQNSTLNFNSKNITITFNEYFSLKNINSELIISPELENKPEIKIKNKQLIIDLNKSVLADSTTYVLNFGNSIIDVNEGNPLGNFQYQFSTGDFIDSLICSGNVINAVTNLPEKDVTVMLHTSLADSAIYKSKPYYITKTNAKGEFKITNIKAGTYQIIVLKESNKNYMFDDKTELIGFFEKPLLITNNIDSLELSIFQEKDTLQHIKKISHTSVGKIELYLSLSSDSISINSPNKFWDIFEINTTKDSLTFWYTIDFKDSSSIIIRDLQHNFADTAFVSTLAKNLQKSMESEFLNYSTNLAYNKLEINEKASINFPEPIADIDTNGVLLLSKDTILLDSKLLFPDNSKKKLVIDYPYKSGEKYFIVLKENSATTILNKKIQKNDTLNFTVKPKEDYGTLKLSVKLEENKNFILQLINSKKQVVTQREINKSQELNFNFLLPDTYQLVMYDDLNKNGKWDTGNFLQKKQAERKYFNPNKITIRANWDLEEDWMVK